MMTLSLILLLIPMSDYSVEARNCSESCNQKIDYVCGEDHTTYINPCYLNCRGVKRRCFGKCPCVTRDGKRYEVPVGEIDAFRKCEAKCSKYPEEGFKILCHKIFRSTNLKTKAFLSHMI